MRTKIGKHRKKSGRYASAGWVGGLAEAAAKVGKGKPSGTGDLQFDLEPRSTPSGYGEFNTLRATAAPATEGQGNRGETQTVEQQLIWNWAKLGTKLEQK